MPGPARLEAVDNPFEACLDTLPVKDQVAWRLVNMYSAYPRAALPAPLDGQKSGMPHRTAHTLAGLGLSDTKE